MILNHVFLEVFPNVKDLLRNKCRVMSYVKKIFDIWWSQLDTNVKNSKYSVGIANSVVTLKIFVLGAYLFYFNFIS